MRFRSEIGITFLVLGVLLPIFVTSASLFTIRNGSVEEQIFMLIILVFPLLFLLWILLDTGYEIENSELKVRCGPLRKSVKIATIQSIECSRSLIASPALSLSRIKIIYAGGKELIISPKNRELFIDELKKRNKNIA